jgi:hypothetical protein
VVWCVAFISCIFINYLVLVFAYGSHKAFSTVFGVFCVIQLAGFFLCVTASSMRPQGSMPFLIVWALFCGLCGGVLSADDLTQYWHVRMHSVHRGVSPASSIAASADDVGILAFSDTSNVWPAQGGMARGVDAATGAAWSACVAPIIDTTWPNLDNVATRPNEIAFWAVSIRTDDSSSSSDANCSIRTSCADGHACVGINHFLHYAEQVKLEAAVLAAETQFGWHSAPDAFFLEWSDDPVLLQDERFWRGARILFFYSVCALFGAPIALYFLLVGCVRRDCGACCFKAVRLLF